ncbi:MAG TPA: hypothetical protein VFT05_18525 [Burkholderiaceae bacterium]|nr:hypothetical protein [Burkholderiaceae bacterium]
MKNAALMLRQTDFGMYKLYDSLKAQLATCEKRAQIVQVLVEQKGKGNPGLAIINSLGNTRTFPRLFTAFCEHGHKANWTWCDPSLNQGSNGFALLDGTEKQGECGVFVDALLLLATLPAPLGLGLGAEALEKIVHKGQFNDGFVVNETKLRQFSICVRCNVNSVINVYKPSNRETDLTLWGNHKVIKFDDCLWDPSYGARYTIPGDVVEFDINETDREYPYFKGRDTFHHEMYFLGTDIMNPRKKYSGPWPQQDLEKTTVANQRIVLIQNYF